MKSKKKLILAGLAIALIATSASWLAVRYATASQEWPDFLTDKQDAPQYNSEVAKRDFGYRTGNHVPVTLYFKLLPGMELMTDQMVINGDFELVSKEEHRERVGEDTHVRVDLVLQAFVLKPKLEVKPTIAYKSTSSGEPKKLDLLTIEVYTSQTYDGRKSEHPKERDLAEINDGHLWVTGAYILAGGIGLVVAVGALVRTRKPRVKKEPRAKVATGPYPAGWTAVQEAWAAIVGGDNSKAAFTKVAESSRSFFAVESLTVSELSGSTLPEKEPLVAFLSICEIALWADKPIEATEIAQATEAMQAIEALLLRSSGTPAKAK